MAERLKAHVLKTCLGHTNVGSNPTPSAIQPVVTTLVVHTKATEVATTRQAWGGARVVEWGRLLSGYRGEIFGRRFESCPPRHRKHVREGVFLLLCESESTTPVVENPKSGDFGLRSYFKLNFIPRCDPLNPSLS